MLKGPRLTVSRKGRRKREKEMKANPQGVSSLPWVRAMVNLCRWYNGVGTGKSHTLLPLEAWHNSFSSLPTLSQTSY